MRQSLKEHPRILDGGLSTALEERGHVLDGLLWTGELLRTAPTEIAEAHKAFVDAGAQIIITSAYQISFTGCSKLGWSDGETELALSLSTELAKIARGAKDVWVAASVGPYGA
ncbi:MAG: homocysteine S-methyltransferase, partial [Actinobacteria bacterium]|nr:homocysteine S-methyltransferase [Actinomycetota bacterium]